MAEKIICVVGPTACGKTKLGVLLAKRYDGEVVSADSMQVYRRMDVGSAKVRTEEMQGIRHHLIDVLDPDEDFNVVLFQKLAKENTEVRKQMNWVRERNQKLENQQKDMKEVIAQASALRTENFVVYPVNKRDKETNWKKCYNLKAEFVITKNVTAKRGDRVIYLRLKRPDDKVIAFSEKSFFKYQNVSLTYSAKREINYEGDRLEMAIYWPNDGSLIKGKYVAELFSDNELIGSTEFTLN